MNDLLTPKYLARELGTTDRAVREVLRKQYGKLQPPETRWFLDSERARFVRATLRDSAVKSEAFSKARSKPTLGNFEQHRRMIEPILQSLKEPLLVESFKSPLEAIGLASLDTSLYSSVWDAVSTVRGLDVLSSFAGGFTATAGGLSIAELGMGLLDDWSSSSVVDDRSDIDEKFEELAQHWAEELASRAPEIRRLADNADLVAYGVQFFRLSRPPRTTAGRLTLAWLTMWAFLHVLAIGLLVDREVTMDAIEVSGAIATVGAGLYSAAVSKRWSTKARAQIDQMNSQDLTD